MGGFLYSNKGGKIMDREYQQNPARELQIGKTTVCVVRVFGSKSLKELYTDYVAKRVAEQIRARGGSESMQNPNRQMNIST